MKPRESAENAEPSILSAISAVSAVPSSRRCGALVVTLLLGFSIRLPGIKITSLSRVLVVCARGRRDRARACRATLATAARRWLSSPAGIFAVITLFAVVMSFGPDIHARGRIVATTNLYARRSTTSCRASTACACRRASR